MPNNYEKVFQLLGLAARARKIVSGTDQILLAIRNKDASIVLLSDDVQKVADKKIRQTAESNDIPLYIIGSREELGHAIGKFDRIAVAVVDKGFGKKIKSLLDESE
ncbi:L7Ae/L30e/S12e/Gadd45 family ribosomal protein [Culicoidibacter larvae]|uniref:Ribosomal protein eL8/eL30/eS12/Gadd45 domain-containing protein n=1 Tax=Culicoidibacter larvae TaxID=2579976 RepID=A0A5R8QFH1_9FIRM|nr:ribosomal L7Ae/L30e/S12e/Gadd45 family protein [Culicoidibacter larvae]TLG76500.1 hypothetical protein FEZ08_02485 [Culicoidibacter larvae]